MSAVVRQVLASMMMLAALGARAADPDDAMSAAEHLAQGHQSFLTHDYQQAEKQLNDALRIVDGSDDRSLRAHAVRMQCLRLLTHTYYPHMKYDRGRAALRTGLRYQALLRQTKTSRTELRADCLIENSLHLAKVHAFLGEDDRAEALLQGIQLSSSVCERDPDLALGVWLQRAAVARRLAKATPDDELRAQWTETAQRRWLQVEHHARVVLRQMGGGNSAKLLGLARRYRPIMAAKEQPDVTLAAFREFLRSCDALDGARAVLLLTRLYAHTDRLPQAEQLAQQLLDQCRRTPPASATFLPSVLSQLGAIEGTLGKLTRAADHYREAIAICEHRRSPSSEPELLEVLAVLYDEWGCVLSARGNYRRAKVDYEKAIQVWHELAKQTAYRSRAQLGLSRTECHLAVLDKASGRHERAIARYTDVIGRIENCAGPASPDLVEPYRLLAECCLAGRQLTEERLAEAERCAGKAVEIAQSHGDALSVRIARHLVAAVDFRRGQKDRTGGGLDRAATSWQTLLAEHRRTQNRLWEGRTLRRLADVHCAKGKYDEAKRLYKAAIAHLERIGAPPITRFNARNMLARLLMEEGRYGDAASHLQEAIRVIEVAGAMTSGSHVQQLQFYEQFNEAYDQLAVCLLSGAEEDVESALFHIDKFRNRVLWDELQLSQSGPRRAKASLGSASDRFKKASAEIRRSLHRLYAKGHPDFITAEEREQLRKLERKLLEVWKREYEEKPDYPNLLPSGPKLPDFQAEIRRLKREPDIVLYYYLGDTESYLCVIADGRLLSYPLMVSADAAKELFTNPGPGPIRLTCSLAVRLVEEYVKVLQKRPPPRRPRRDPRGNAVSAEAADETADQSTRSYGPEVPESQLPWHRRFRSAGSVKLSLQEFGPQQALALSETLLPAAVIRQIEERRFTERRYPHMIIVADPALQRLPFQALPVKSAPTGTSDSTYLVDEPFPAICYAPSLQVLSVLRSRSVKQRPAGKVVTVGGWELPGARAECEMFAERFAGRVIRPPLIGPRATEGLLRTYAPRCGLIHFADHAAFRANTDNLTGALALFQSGLRPKPPLDNDGWLELPEIYELNLEQCQAVILSACSTGQGKSSRLDSGKSLARAFLVAGTPRVIATFWDVGDGVPGPIMEEFFGEIADGFANNGTIDYAKALQAAMQTVKGNAASPRDWAPIAVVGPPIASWAPESPKEVAQE